MGVKFRQFGSGGGGQQSLFSDPLTGAVGFLGSGWTTGIHSQAVINPIGSADFDIANAGDGLPALRMIYTGSANAVITVWHSIAGPAALFGPTPFTNQFVQAQFVNPSTAAALEGGIGVALQSDNHSWYMFTRNTIAGNTRVLKILNGVASTLATLAAISNGDTMKLRMVVQPTQVQLFTSINGGAETETDDASGTRITSGFPIFATRVSSNTNTPLFWRAFQAGQGSGP
jgi:hypothetical protein